MKDRHLFFLKLGGSLITQKGVPHTPRYETLKRLAEEIAAACHEDPKLHLVLGHGSGSYGHMAAEKHGTRQGAASTEQWLGFAEVWREAAALDHLVLAELQKAGLPVIAFPPSAMVTTEDGQVATWNVEPLRAALNAELLPVVYGDVVFDKQRGGTILSTEEVFLYLAPRLNPERVLLAGIEEGVWEDFPGRRHLISEITPDTYEHYLPVLGGSTATDVTGGMAGKVKQMLSLVSAMPGLETSIFSGEVPGMVKRLLLGGEGGTAIRGSRL